MAAAWSGSVIGEWARGLGFVWISVWELFERCLSVSATQIVILTIRFRILGQFCEIVVAWAPENQLSYVVRPGPPLFHRIAPEFESGL